MKPEIKKKFVARLRELGNTKQTSCQLIKGDCFCLAGVLCDVAVKAGIGIWKENDLRPDKAVGFYDNNSFYHGSLPYKVKQWADIGSFMLISSKPTTFTNDLLISNDCGYATFSEFADLIEAGDIA